MLIHVRPSCRYLCYTFQNFFVFHQNLQEVDEIEYFQYLYLWTFLLHQGVHQVNLLRLTHFLLGQNKLVVGRHYQQPFHDKA